MDPFANPLRDVPGETVQRMNNAEDRYGQEITASQTSAGHLANNPLLIEYVSRRADSYWGFDRILIRDWEGQEYGDHLRFVDHARGVVQFEKPAPLPKFIEEFESPDPKITWPMYRVKFTPLLRPTHPNYVKPVETALRIEYGQPMTTLVKSTHHRLMAEEWQTERRWKSRSDLLGVVYYLNDHSLWVQRDHPHIIADYSTIGDPEDIKLDQRLGDFRTTAAKNTRDILVETCLGFVKKYVSIHVLRSSLFEQSYKQMMNMLMGFQLRRKLKVKYIGEAGADLGGLFNDLITNLGKEFLAFKTGNYQLFETCPTTGFTVSKLAAGAKELLPIFRFFGRFLGVLLVHGYNLGFALSIPLIKQIKGETVTTRDLAADGLFIQGLRAVINAERDDEIVDFAPINSADIVAGILFNLIPDGHNKPVTIDNRDDYIKKLVLLKSGGDRSIIDAIRHGIDEVLPISWLGYFTASELMLIICGTKKCIKVSDWSRHTDHQKCVGNAERVGWFWQIVRIYSVEAQYKLLEFWTGLGTLPSDGITGVKQFILRIIDNSDVRRPPNSNTCSHQLNIPRYATKQIMFDQLTESIYTSEGFGFD